MVTDSVIGTLVEQLPNGFVLRTDDGVDVVLEVGNDTIQELQEIQSDTTVMVGPHSGVMDGRDVRFALRQLEESSERKRVLVHYFTHHGCREARGGVAFDRGRSGAGRVSRRPATCDVIVA